MSETPRTKAKIKENLGLLMEFFLHKYGKTDYEVEQELFNALSWTADDVEKQEQERILEILTHATCERPEGKSWLLGPAEVQAAVRALGEQKP